MELGVETIESSHFNRKKNTKFLRRKYSFTIDFDH